MTTLQLMLSCEHAGNEIPGAYEALFISGRDELQSHRGWDPGALELTHYLGDEMQVVPFIYPYTRLLIEVNRSASHPQLFSEFTQSLSPHEKVDLLTNYYLPHRNQVEAAIRNHIEKGYVVIHLAVHSFTPVWEGKKREVEFGLLFDPDRKEELNFCELWKQAWGQIPEKFAVRFNEPYLGKDDGLTTYLRSQFSPESYLGIELEVNQKFLATGLNTIEPYLADTFRRALVSYASCLKTSLPGANLGSIA